MTSLFDSLLASKELHSEIGNNTEYRNKITYTLTEQGLNLTNLARHDINAICVSVWEWKMKHTKLPKECWNEVSVKATRTNAVLIKLVMVKSGTVNLFSQILMEEQQSFIQFLLSRFPQITTIVLQSSPTSGKPTKNDPYTTLYGSSYISELTSNGVVFELSADAFTEINHVVEDAAFQLMLCWLIRGYGSHSAPHPAQSSSLRDLAVIGRDINSVVLGVQPFGWFQNIYGFTQCPRAIADCR